MSRVLGFIVASLVLCLSFSVFAADTASGQSKTGVIKSVDTAAKSFVVTLPSRPLTFKVDDKTVYTLDGKASTFDAAVKAELKVTVSYTRSGEERLASKVEASTPEKK